jgi:hypothetical protein
MKSLLVRSVALAATVFIAGAANAETLSYSVFPYYQASDSPYASLNFDYFYLEDFEDGALNTPGVGVNAGVVASSSEFVDSVDADDGAVDGNGVNGHSYYSNNATDRFEFTFDPFAFGGTLPSHAGIVWTDVGFSGHQNGTGFGDVTLNAFDAANVLIATVSLPTLGNGDAHSSVFDDYFLGVTHTPGISRIVLITANSVDWEADHLQYGRVTEVPEPASMLLLSFGALSGLALRRRS